MSAHTPLAALPPFLPTASPHDLGVVSSASPAGGDLAGAMGKLALHEGGNQVAHGIQRSPPPLPYHPLPPRPHVLPHFSQPPFPVGDMSLPDSGENNRPEPPWATACPLPPIMAHGAVPPPLGALGLVHGRPPPPPQPMFLCGPIPVPPRPHPCVTQPLLYVSFVPADMVPDDFDQPLRRQGVNAVAIRLPHAVKPIERIYPDSYYNWMTKNGCLQFQSVHDTEKALSILLSHQYFISKSVLVSPLPPPNCSPIPPAPVAPRFIRPITLTSADMAATYPQPGQLYDFIRPWGSIREISISLEESIIPGSGSAGECRWGAKVQFWFEDEAFRFETSHAGGATFDGWEIDVRRDPSYIPMAPLPFQQPVGLYGPHPMGPPFAPIQPLAENQHSPPAPRPQHFSSPHMTNQQISPETATGMPLIPMRVHQEGPFAVYPSPVPNHVGLPVPMNPDVAMSPNGIITPLSPVSPAPGLRPSGPMPNAGMSEHSQVDGANSVHGMGTANGQPSPFALGLGAPTEWMSPMVGPSPMMTPPSPPQPPPPIRYIPPWALQNGGARLPISPPYPPMALPYDQSPVIDPSPHHGPFTGDRNAVSNGTQSWREVPGGFVSEEGQVIQHIPYRPLSSPKKGRGRPELCGLIVKNLSPDVSSNYLSDVFSKFGYLTHVRVMRDASQRSRGFGFVNFHLPEDALKALNQMNGTDIAGRLILVQFQERQSNARGFPGNRGRGSGARRSSDGFAPTTISPPKETTEDTTPPVAASSSVPLIPVPTSARSIPKAEPVADRSDHEQREACTETISGPVRLQVSRSPKGTLPQKDPVSYENVTLDSLSVMQPAEALDIVRAGGQALLQQIKIDRHSSAYRLDQSPKSNKISIAGAVNKLVHHSPAVNGISPSRLASCIRAFVNSLDEDDEKALAELLQYPELVNGMIVHRLQLRQSPQPSIHRVLPA